MSCCHFQPWEVMEEIGLGLCICGELGLVCISDLESIKNLSGKLLS